MSVDLKKHWSGVNTNWRHIVTSIPQAKQKRIIYNFYNYFLNELPKDDIHFAVDWGCGGGLLTKELKTFTQVLALDICEDSLNSCKEFAAPDFAELVPNDLLKFEYNYNNVDMLLAHAIVWHFPTLEYFKDVIDIWTNKIKAKYIAFNTKKLDKKGFSQVHNYKKNFLQALYLNDKFVIELFKGQGYSLLSSTVVTTGLQPQTYFVFKREPEKV